MVTLFVQHKVKDIEPIKHDAQEAGSNPQMAQMRAQWSIVETTMYRTVDDRAVIVAHKFNDQGTAQKFMKFMESEDVRAMMEQSGAIFPLTMWLAEEI